MRQEESQQHDLVKSVITSLLVCVPTFCASVWVMEAKPLWTTPAVTMLVILGMTAANFAALVFLEHYRTRIGGLTLPTIVGAVGIVVLFVIAESLNRFVRDFGYDWLFPVIMIYLLLSFVAIFREKVVMLKLHLSLNVVVIAILWTLGAADKIALPF